MTPRAETLRSIPPLALLLLAVLAAPGHGEGLAIQGATVHSLVAPPSVATVLIEDGTIVQVGSEVAVPSNARVLDGSGLNVYPGLFDAMSQLGLVEIGSISATVDAAEIGEFNPHLSAATAVHPASEVIPVTRANGITHAVAAPRAGRGGGVIPGQAVVMHLDGWTVEEMLIEPSVGMMLAWPAIQTTSFDFATFSRRTTPYTEAKKEAEEKANALRDWLDAARHYAQAMDAEPARAPEDLKLAALARVLDGELPVLVSANAERDIRAAVAFAEEEGLRMILVGGREAWKAKELLAEKEIPVILGRPQSLPGSADEPYDQPYRAAGELHAAGIRIAFGTGDASGSRTLPYEAATAVAFGLPWEEAVRAVTLYPAEILGVGDRLGSVEVGKVANLIVTDGDPLDIQTEVKHLIVGGRVVSTENRHRSLYERYRAR